MRVTRGLSWSWRRFLGIAGLKGRIARKAGIPTTMSGLQRKVGRILLRLIGVK